MREGQSFHHQDRDFLRYEIREVVRVAQSLEQKGKTITWENIGDPISRGHLPPQWLVDQMIQNLSKPSSFGYGPSQGLLESREFLCRRTNDLFGTTLHPSEIVFTNGLGDAIATLYRSLDPKARILLPSPVYPTHYALEAFHAGAAPIQYPLDPQNNWAPDFEFIRSELEKNQNIAGILLVNPDNPTGTVHTEETLSKLASLAREFHIFLIVDEIYAGIQTSPSSNTYAAPYLRETPAILMQGISKLIPWPGGRCGWMEFHLNSHKGLEEVLDTVCAHKRLEVGSTTLPQTIISQVFRPDRFEELKESWSHFLQKRISIAYEYLEDIKGLRIQFPQGAFYLCPTFERDALAQARCLPIEAKFHEVIHPYLENASEDKRFTLQLLASTGICVVPLSSFHTDLAGFRFTLLEKDDEAFIGICRKLRQMLLKFLNLGTNEKMPGFAGARSA